MSDFAETNHLLVEAALRLRECQRPSDILEVIPALERCIYDLASYFDKEDAPIIFQTIDLPAKRLRGVVAIGIADPDGSSRQTFYVGAELDDERFLPLLKKSEREKVAVLLERWARFFAEKTVRSDRALKRLRVALRKIGIEQPPSSAGKGRRQTRFDPRKDQQLAEEWERAREAGTEKKDFAKDKKIPLKDLRRALDRHRHARK